MRKQGKEQMHDLFFFTLTLLHNLEGNSQKFITDETYSCFMYYISNRLFQTSNLRFISKTSSIRVPEIYN